MRKLYPVIILLSFTTSLFSIQTSSESVNPFNQFMDPSGGCDLYSGNAAFSIPLISLQGHNGTDVQVALSYSSNVTVNARSMNKYGSTPWVGLGWTLQFGSIKCDHKGTVTHSDDDFYYVAGAGSVNRLLKPERLKYQFCSTYTYNTLDSINKAEFDESGKCTYFNYRRTYKHVNYAFIFEGKIKLHQSGQYRFHVKSDDGCRIYLDGVKIVDNDGKHEAIDEKSSQSVYKDAGYHNIRVEYFQHEGLKGLSIQYTPPDGVKREIPIEDLRDPDVPDEELDKEFYVENSPYLKCEHVDFNGDSIYDSWVLTNTDGTKMIFGKINAGDVITDNQNSTRYTFAQNGFVGTVTDSHPFLYPYQWDLRAVINTFGDTVRYWYQQDIEPVKTDSFDSRSIDLFYTKASYPDSIVNSSGKSLKFELERKKFGDQNEEYDPYVYGIEPDGFIEMFENKRLKKIHVYSPELKNPVKTIELNYDFLNVSLGSDFIKSMLKSIEWKNNKANVVENRYEFQYNDDITMSDNDSGDYNPDYHYGAIRTVKDYHGAITEYNYIQVKQDVSDTTDYGNGIIKRKNSKMSIFRWILGDDNNGPLIHGDSGIFLHSGSYDNGKDYIVIQGGKKHDRLWLYTFDGFNWKLDANFYCTVFNEKEEKRIVSFENGFLYSNKDSNDDDAMIIFWQNGKWYYNNIAVNGNGNHVTDIQIGNDFLVIRGGNGDHDKDHIWIYRRIENEWVEDKQYFNYKVFENHDSELKIATGNNFVAIARDNTRWACVLRWNGREWIRTELIDFNNGDDAKYHKVYACNNYLTIMGGGDKNYIWLFYWNGSKWILDDYYRCRKLFNEEHEKLIYTQSDYFVIKKVGVTEKQMCFVTWNGRKWVTQLLPTLPSGEKYVEVFPGPNFVAIRGGNASTYDEFTLYRKQDNTSSMSSIWVNDIPWQRLFDENDAEIKDSFSIASAQNSFAIANYGRYTKKTYRWIYRYNGSRWEKIYTSIINPQDWLDKNYQSICSTPTGFGFTTQNIKNFSLEFVHKFQDNFESIKSYVVSRKTNISLSTAETLFTTYEYEEPHFNAYIGSLRFNKVSVISENNGKTVNYFFNSTSTNNQNNFTNLPLSEKNNGLKYKTELLNEDGQLISDSRTNYRIYQKSHWPDNVFEKRTQSTAGQKEGIYDSSYTMGFKYGMPYKSANFRSNNKAIVSRTKFAYEVYDEMKERYMLNQQYQTVVFERPWDGISTLNAEDIRSSQVTKWAKDPSYSFYAPCSSLVWNVKCDNAGKPVITSGYDIYDMSQPYWDFNGTVNRYNKHGVPLEKMDKSGKVSSVFLGTPRMIPVGSADNCSYSDLAVFTGDYVIDKSGKWWDSLQGWERGPGSMLVSDSTHFGQKVVLQNYGWAVRRNNTVKPGKSYIASVWVNPRTRKVVLKADFRHSTTNDRDAYPLRNLQVADSLGIIGDSVTADNSGKWKMLRIEIPSSITSRMNPEYDWYCNITIGAPIETMYARCYIDDVRFYPKDAHVTTTYYDTLYYQPILTVDENNNPGMLVKYDLQGRPEKWYKINKFKPEEKTRVMKKEYHLFGE